VDACAAFRAIEATDHRDRRARQHLDTGLGGIETCVPGERECQHLATG